MLFRRKNPAPPAAVNWLTVAEKYLGTTEVKGAKHNPVIVKWWAAIRMHFTDDETPWCAGFVGGVLEECGIRSTRSAAARSYENWGQKLSQPALGCIVVFWRGRPSGSFGHVGFVAGRDQFGNLMVLGGNQGDAVNIRPFSWGRVLDYRWPSGVPLPTNFDLPLIRSGGQLSTNEA